LAADRIKGLVDKLETPVVTDALNPFALVSGLGANRHAGKE
jgi:hypothetical protein